MHRSSKQEKENAVSFKTPGQKNVKPTKLNAAKTPFATSAVSSSTKPKTENAKNDKTIKFNDTDTPTCSTKNSSKPNQKTKTPIRALRDITNRTPRAKSVKFTQETSCEKIAISKQQSQRTTTLRGNAPKKSVVTERADTKDLDQGIDEVKNSRGAIFETKVDENEEDVPDVEYCPPPVEEPPYEPSDELKIDFEFFREPPSADAYEFENIKFKEPSFPTIDPSEYRSRDVLDYYELRGFDDLTFGKFDLGSDFEFETAFDDFQFDLGQR